MALATLHGRRMPRPYPRRGRDTFARQFVEGYLEHLTRLNFSPATIYGRRSAMRVFFREVGTGLRIRELTSQQIERFILRTGVSPRTAETNLMELSSFCKYLIKQGVLKENPCKGVERPRWTFINRPAPSPDEYNDIRRSCQTLEEAAFVELLYFSGLRISELRSIRMRDIRIAERRIRIMGKGRKERMVVFPESCAATMQKYVDFTTPFRTGSPGDYLFIHVTTRGRGAPSKHTSDLWHWAEGRFPGATKTLTGRDPGLPFSRHVLREMLKRLGECAGLSYKLTPHIMRHGFFRMLKVRGVPLEIASRLGGHSDITTTAKIYGRLSDDDLQTAYDRALDQRGVA